MNLGVADRVVFVRDAGEGLRLACASAFRVEETRAALVSRDLTTLVPMGRASHPAL